MKISMNTCEDISVYTVLLNGNPVELCAMADEETGTVHLLEKHWSTGNLITDSDSPYGYRYIELTGRVEIEDTRAAQSGSSYPPYDTPYCCDDGSNSQPASSMNPCDPNNPYYWGVCPLAEPRPAKLEGFYKWCQPEPFMMGGRYSFKITDVPYISPDTSPEYPAKPGRWDWGVKFGSLSPPIEFEIDESLPPLG